MKKQNKINIALVVAILVLALYICWNTNDIMKLQKEVSICQKY